MGFSGKAIFLVDSNLSGCSMMLQIGYVVLRVIPNVQKSQLNFRANLLNFKSKIQIHWTRTVQLFVVIPQFLRKIDFLASIKNNKFGKI